MLKRCCEVTPVLFTLQKYTLFYCKQVFCHLNCVNIVTKSKVFAIFAENMLHSAKLKQASFALICNIFAENMLHSAKLKQASFALICNIFAEDMLPAA